jgi:hypothetical protein
MSKCEFERIGDNLICKVCKRGIRTITPAHMVHRNCSGIGGKVIAPLQKKNCCGRSDK